jgi:predicted negative regulator of RcsB-dependent stress response
MATSLNLEEQEQLDQVKHFWARYGNLITWALIAVFGSVAAYNGYTFWQKRQALQAAAMYDEVSRIAVSGDATKMQRAFSDLKDRFGGTAFGQQGGLLAAKTFATAGQMDQATAALNWVADNALEPEYRAIARLRWAAALADAQKPDEALKVLDWGFPAEFAGLVADRRGDLLLLKGQRDAARLEYEKAYRLTDDKLDYRRMVEVKLNALGVDANGLSDAKAAAAGDAKP